MLVYTRENMAEEEENSFKMGCYCMQYIVDILMHFEQKESLIKMVRVQRIFQTLNNIQLPGILQHYTITKGDAHKDFAK